MRAMILAAGLGTRLRPLTEHLPKPLVPVLGRPLLGKIIEDLAEAGVEHIVVNTHHLAGEIEKFIEEFTGGHFPYKISLSHEPNILGTGGALVKARDLLDTGDFFLLHNGDALTNMRLKDLIACHSGAAPPAPGTAPLATAQVPRPPPEAEDEWSRRAAARAMRAAEAVPDILATLALTNYEPENKILVSPRGKVLDILSTLGVSPPPGSRTLAYTGIAVLSRGIFDYLPENGYASIIDALIKAIARRPGCVGAFTPRKFYWNDLGNLRKYLAAHRDILVNRLLDRRAAAPNPFSIWPGSRVSRKARLSGFVSVGPDCEIKEGASLEDSVVLKGTVVQTGKTYVRAVIGKDFCVAEELEGMKSGEIPRLGIVRACGFGTKLQATPLVEHGSDRLFFRLAEKERTSVLMVSPKDDPDFERYIAIGKFLHGKGLGTPEIYEFDLEKKALVMEDLGDGTLYLLARDEKDKRKLATLYRKTIDLLASIQTETQESLADCPSANERVFDYGQLRWETDYFRDNFLEMDIGLDEGETSALEEEFHSLADAVSRHPLRFMHRDFQSQNILLKKGKVRIVDFQGARKGSMAYDLSSLLRDAYVEIPKDLRCELLDYCHAKLSAASGNIIERENFAMAFLLAGLQRNMQALGAFSFLSLVKKKRQFRKFVPLCLRHLREGLQELNDSRRPPGPLPQLTRICSRIKPKR